MTTRALVVGGTGGIGHAIACRIAADPSATVIISGRTKPTTIPHTNMEFRPLDASSMQSIKKYAQQYREAQNKDLDLLVLSQGILSTAGRTETPEGIDRKMALHYYGRQLLIRELTPILKDDGKVLIVLDGERGDPSKLNWEDLALKKHFSVSNAANHCISMTDAMIQVYAAQQKAQGSGRRHFIHALPGIVRTNLFDGLPWYLRGPTQGLGYLLGTTPETCAENMLKGIDNCVAEGEKEDRSWSCIDAKGNVVRNKPTWSEEQLVKIRDHTWETVDSASGKST